VSFTPFLTEDDYEDLRWYLEDYMDLPDGGAVLRAERIERSLETWGTQAVRGPVHRRGETALSSRARSRAS